MKFVSHLPVRSLFRAFSTGRRCNAFKMNEFSVLHNTDLDDSMKSDMNSLFSRALQSLVHGQQVFIIQPHIKWGPKKKRNTTPELQLDESVSLINTLEGWKVIGKTIIGLYTFSQQSFFGKGKLEEIRALVQNNTYITALFVSIDILNRVQHDFLEQYFGIPVYDRYLIVMQIFREHAASQEAKIQIALAELPYLYSRMRYQKDGSLARIGSTAQRISGTTQFADPDTRKLILHKHEGRLRQKLEKLRSQRDIAREAKRADECPIVAVVGYTNSGKTSLIKVLTGEEKLVPRNCLFATLDVTYYTGMLPCLLKVSYIDTIGFISDIPEHLIEPFSVTLRDAMNADIIVHVLDISHPDWRQQHDKVFETLEQLDIEKKLLSHVISVGNKIDLIKNEESLLIPSEFLKTSCVTLRGIDEVTDRMEEEIMKATHRKHMVIRVRNGGEEFHWLKSEAAVPDMKVDPNNSNYMLMSVLITDSLLERFKRTFIPSKSR